MKFQCPQCGQALETQTIYTGQAVSCPNCGGGMVVPSTKSGSAGSAGSASPLDKVLVSDQNRKYEVGETVAKGGMGAILNARDVNLRRSVAMKVILDPKNASEDQLFRFVEEAQITGQLEHPGIVPLHDLGIDAQGNAFYTMKFVKGRTLGDILDGIREGGAETIREYPLTHLLTIFQKVCDAIAFAHSRQVIHRDLKPENVMVGDYGEVLVMDWGLAKVLPRKGSVRGKTLARAEGGNLKPERGEAKQKPQVSLLRPPGYGGQAGLSPQPSPVIDSVRAGEAGEMLKTMDGAIMGTPGFMSPEQAMGETEKIDERTDIYALGAILYNILTLRVPITGSTLAEIIDKVSTGNIPHPSEFNPTSKTRNRQVDLDNISFTKDKSPRKRFVDLKHLPDEMIPESLSAVTMKALCVRVDERYQSVKDLQKEIEAYQGGFATGAENANAWKQFVLFVKRHKAVSCLVVSIVLLVTLGSVFSTMQWIKAEKARQLALDSEQVAIKERKQAQANLDALRGVAPDLIEASDLNIQQSISSPSGIADALRKISYAVDLVPSNAQFRCAQGNILQLSLKFEEAEHAYAEACRLVPTNKIAIMNKELCHAIVDEHRKFADLPVGLVSRLFVLKTVEGRIYSILPLITAWFGGDGTLCARTMYSATDSVLKEFVEKPQQIHSKAFLIGGHHYILYPIPTTWDDAGKYCESVGAHLATINNAEEDRSLSAIKWEIFSSSSTRMFQNLPGMGDNIGDRFFVGFSIGSAGKPQWGSGESFTNAIGWKSDKGVYGGGFDKKKGQYVLEEKKKKLPFLIEWDR